eukprot:GFUD01043077.1.p1 GENE.GFUD01043077.1~~GFUD01043077.1.p1  ORF type:complete len:706 (+),score=195.97 GFUD01043077.1:233-2350(+)
MSKLQAPSSGARGPQVSRLAPPGSLTKRPREGSVDLETGLDAKKSKMEAPSAPVTNLAKSKSRSMMSIAGARPAAGRAGTAGGRVGVVAGASKPKTTLARPGADRRQTTTALNDRTNSSMGRPGLAREKSSLVRSPAGAGKPAGKAAGGKRPAWDLKGRLEDMERMFDKTNRRVEDLETEKQTLQTDVEVKKEVVVQSSEEIRTLRSNIERSEQELENLRRSLREKEEQFNEETVRLKRQLEDEQYTKSSLERRLKSLEDELSSKQTEVAGLKNSVAELSSSRAGVEASLSGAKTELEEARTQILALKTESERKSEEIKTSLAAQEEMQAKLRWEESERRKLHNLVQELKGNIRVFCRMRPLLGEEKDGLDEIRHVNIQWEKTLELIKTVDSANESIAGGLNKNMKYDFEFDRVFGPTSSQADVFAEISQLVQSALDGYNVCVFAYGQTGSGKTFTMEGGPAIENDESECGMIPRTIRQIFEVQEKLKEKCWQYNLQASFLEIYNEEIRDLLTSDTNYKCEIKMSDSKGTDLHVTNLKSEEVTSESQIASMIRRARKNRAQAKTLCNERSSRSHSVFMLKIEGYNTATTETCCGTLNLVDLAGSERIKDSGSEGMRLTEAQAINKSLSNLGNVIMALAQKNSHVPYRNSKLTHLLQNCLGGNSKTLMFVNISPKEECFSETLNSLRFATKVNQCNIGTACKKAAK